MAKQRKIETEEGRNWTEAELVLQFQLNRIVEYQTPLMREWLKVENPIFDVVEQSIFDNIYQRGVKNMSTWSEEDLRNEIYYLCIGIRAFKGRKRHCGLFR